MELVIDVEAKKNHYLILSSLDYTGVNNASQKSSQKLNIYHFSVGYISYYYTVRKYVLFHI